VKEYFITKPASGMVTPFTTKDGNYIKGFEQIEKLTSSLPGKTFES